MSSNPIPDTLYSLNGKIVPEAEAVVPVTDRGFLYGDGLFETLHAYGQQLFRADAHFDRLLAGAKTLHFDPLPDIPTLKVWLTTAIKAAAFPEANVRMTVTRGSGPRGPSIKGPFALSVVITVSRHIRPPESILLQGVSAVVATLRRQESAATAMLKTLNYIEQILAKREADLAGASEALLLNNAGLLCEGSASNISLIRDGKLTIPDPKLSGALPGIAQLTAIEAAHNLGIPVVYACLSPWDPGVADEAFLTGSMREISPLVRVGDTPAGGGKPGPITLKLVAEFRRIIERECTPFTFPK
ncbi:MAG: aminotransferase class IV [Planctomycetota bacterium]